MSSEAGTIALAALTRAAKMFDQLDDRPIVIALPARLYDAAEAEGFDMRAYFRMPEKLA